MGLTTMTTPVICRHDGRRFVVAELTDKLRCVCGSSDLDFDDGKKRGWLIGWQSPEGEQGQSLVKASSEIEALRWFRINVGGLQPRTIWEVPDDAIESVTTAVRSGRRIKAEGAKQIRAMEGDPPLGPVGEGDPPLGTLPENGQFAQPFTDDGSDTEPEEKEAHKTAASNWMEFLEIVDYSYGPDPFGPGSKGYYVYFGGPPTGQFPSGPLHDEPFGTRGEAVTWAKQNWKKYAPKMSAKQARLDWFHCRSCGLDYSSASAYGGCPNCGSSDVVSIDRFSPRASKTANDAEAAGRAAYHAGEPRRFPEPIPSGEVGSEESQAWVERGKAWYAGWDKANVAAGIEELDAEASKVREITEGILATNPGMNREAATKLATKTVEQFPQMVKEADISPEEAGVKVGDIFVASWGYDQTNVDFYQVMDLTPASARLAPMGRQHVDSTHVVPTRPNPERLMTKRIMMGRDVPYFTIDSSRTAFPWDGRPEFETPAGMGH